MLAGFFILVGALVVLHLISSDSSTHTASTPTPASNTPPVSLPDNKTIAQRGDEAKKLIAKCGKPDRDFTKIEGGQPIRHLIYSKQNVELMYSREGVPSWVLTGIFLANADENIDKDEANRRLPCAAGSIRTVLD